MPHRSIHLRQECLVPYLTIQDCAKAIEFYQRVLDAQEVTRMTYPQSDKIMHAELRIRGARIMLSEEMRQWGSRGPLSLNGTSVALMLYVADVDDTFRRFLEEGASSLAEPQDMFWGERFAKVADPFGHVWGLAKHQRFVNADERQRGAEDYFAASMLPIP